MNGYDLSREWFNFSFENPEKIKPIHTAIYFFAIEHCNRLGWKEKFGFPTTMVMEAIGVKSYNTYIKALNDLVQFGFLEMIEKSRNQHSSNIVALSKNVKARNKALDKALIKHGTKQGESTQQSTVSINKQETKNNKQETINNIYKHYPSKCKNRGTSTGKSSKDKEKIAKLLKTHSEEHLIACIDFAIKEGQKGMLKNFSTFLNNLPDLDEVNQDQEQEKQIKDIVFKYTSIPGNIWKSQDEYDKWEYRLKWKHDKNGIGTPYPKYLEGAIKVKLGI